MVRAGLVCNDFFDSFRKNPLSQHHLRHEKNCLNCGATVEARYCSRCGQENIEPKESVGHLIGHFFADITHYDSKLFITLKDLVFRPGYLTREYAAGRRTRYLNPIRMYVFISAIFFLVLYAGKGEQGSAKAEINTHAANLFRQHFADSLRDAAKSEDSDSVRAAVMKEVAARLDTAQVIKAREESLAFHLSGSGLMIMDLVENKYRTVREFDSVQAKLPETKREDWLMRWLLRNDLRLKEEHGGRSGLRLETNLQHTIPKLMFFLLPLFAFYVKLLYLRKKYVYTHYVIFSVHFHSFYFLVMLLALSIGALFDSVWLVLGLPTFVLLLTFIYLAVALRNMFGQSRWVSFLKAVAITTLYTVTIMAAFLIVMAIAFLGS